MKCLDCNAEIEENANFCTQCGVEAPINSIGGWLIFVGIGIVFSPLIMFSQMVPLYSDLLKPGMWNALTSVGSQYYIESYSILLIAEMIINALIFSISLYLIFLFFSKKVLFKKVYIGLAVFTPIFLFSDAFIVQKVLEMEELFDAETSKELFKSIITVCIWVPYMLMSKRVKRTFIN